MDRATVFGELTLNSVLCAFLVTFVAKNSWFRVEKARRVGCRALERTSTGFTSTEREFLASLLRVVNLSVGCAPLGASPTRTVLRWSESLTCVAWVIAFDWTRWNGREFQSENVSHREPRTPRPYRRP